MILEGLEVFEYGLAELTSLEELLLISVHSPWADHMVEKIQSCKLGIRLLKMFFWSVSTLGDTDAVMRHILIHVNHTLEDIWGISIYKLIVLSPLANTKHEIENWILDLQGRIQYCKQKFEESSELLLQYSLRCSYFEDEMTLDFLDAILENLKNVYKFKTDDEILLLNIQIGTLEKKVTLLHNLFNLTPVQWRDFKEMRAFKFVVHAFAHCSAILVFLYWVRAVDEEMATQLNFLLFNVLQKIKPCDPVFKAFYIRFLKEMRLMQLDSLLLGQIIQFFLDLLLENLVDILKDEFQILQESLMFIIAFLANPPDQHAEDEELMLITTEIEVLIIKDLYLVLSVDDMKDKGNFSKASTCLSDFLRKVELLQSRIRCVYGQIQDSISYPKTNGLGFFDFLLQNLGFLMEKLKRNSNFISFAKHLIIKIRKELMSLRPYLNDLFEQQKEHKELKDTWLKVIDLAYQTEYAINLCSVIGHPLWFNMAHLMQVLDEIKVVKSKLMKIEDRKTYDGGDLNCIAVALNKVPEDLWASSFNDVMVGLEEEVEKIVDNLIRGSMSLKIVAIVGMPGLGKTTMANKVYNAPTVRNHFHMFAYCIVSQVHTVRRLLLDILGDIKGKNDKMYNMVEEDAAEMLRRCLKGKRYLIIMDDIWDVKAWDEVERSLPNDQNGSRVLFMTRIRNVAIQAKKDCIFHDLRFLTDDESWELMRKKVFRAEGCPSYFLEVGKMIAKNCEGLPLTIVLIAGLLARTERNLSWWNHISETIGSYASTEGCKAVLELSYQHLPEHLKPCFLYFGALSEDTLIRVSKLMLLWISEGFVQDSNREKLENVAKEYLRDLVDRSLVIVDSRSSYGGIKSCRIHDVVHEFCQKKAQDENFLQLMGGHEASFSSSSTTRNPYRVCIHIKGKYLSDATKTCPNIHSLLDSRKTFRGDYHYVSNLKLVRVIDLEGLQWDTCSIKEIASLVHLRFIATSFLVRSPKSFIVPSSISDLWNLEILILNGRYQLELPGTIWKMTRLRHVDVGWCYLNDSGVKKHEACPKMVNLESFSCLKIFSAEHLKDFLQRSPSLRKLSFDNKNVDKESVHFPNLDSLSKLESLKVYSVGEACLRSFNFLSALKKLSLSCCHLDWRYLAVISKMPCLEVLKVLAFAFVGLKWDMENTEFPKLSFRIYIWLNGLRMTSLFLLWR